MSPWEKYVRPRASATDDVQRMDSIESKLAAIQQQQEDHTRTLKRIETRLVRLAIHMGAGYITQPNSSDEASR